MRSESPLSWGIIAVGFVLVNCLLTHAHLIEVNITVPDFKIETEDAYVCISAQLPPRPHKLVGVIPHARQEVVHHILLYGCSEPHIVPTNGKPEPWRCDMLPVCNGPSVIMYGWGRNAPDLKLPAGVGFSVGEFTGVKYIVAQVHYLAVRPPDDHSGVTLVLKPHAVPYAAGLMSYASWFDLPPGKGSHLIQNSCCFKSYEPLTMFAVRVHTHSLGRQVYMVREAWNHSGSEVLISRDPQLPQSFVPSPLQQLWPGDRLTVVCDYNTTTRTDVTHAGSTHNDEMCNMYVMVYGKTPYMTMCDNSIEDIRDDSPGAFPRGATLQWDSSPFWKPPTPEGTAGDPLGQFGDATSVTTGPDGSLWVLYRASGVWQVDTFSPNGHISRTQPVPEAVVARLDPDNGTVLARWGAGVFYLPHMISVDALGNVWVVDTGRHQVLKFTPDGKLLMTVGKELTPGGGKERFCQPTQVSVLRDGSFVVGDGYCNNRVVLFDAQGQFVAESVRIDRVVHSVLVDECEGLVYAASREAGTVHAVRLPERRPGGGFAGSGEQMQLVATHDLQEAGGGEAWALRFGPYGEQLALVWTEGQNAKLVNVKFPQEFWTLPATAELSPHDFVLGGAPIQLSGGGDRLFAVYLASVGVACDKHCGPLHKLVVVPRGYQLPDVWDPYNSGPTKDIHPGDAVELPHGTIAAEHEKAQAATGGAATAAQGQVQADQSGEAAAAAAADVAKDDEGGAMVADDYDEDVEGDAVDAEDYEESKEAEEQEEEEELAQEQADYMEMATGERPNITVEAVFHHAAPLPLDKERFEVLVEDKEAVRQATTVSGWTITLAVLLALVMGITVFIYSKGALVAYVYGDTAGSKGAAGDGADAADAILAGGFGLSPGSSGGSAAGPGGEKPKGGAGLMASVGGAGAGAGAARGLGGVVAAAQGLLGRLGVAPKGGWAKAAGVSSGAAAREVAAARERERLLRSSV